MFSGYKLSAVGCLIGFIVNAQQIQPLKIGDSMPSVSGLSMLHSPGRTTFPYSGKRLQILDFWASWCTNCTAKFPQMDSLQKQFAGDMDIVTVNHGEDSSRINKFLARYHKRTGSRFDLPIVTGDTILSSLFPHATIPHYAWIYNGKLLATTGAEMVTEENIKKVLAGNPVQLKIKKEVMDYQWEKPLLENDNGGTVESLLYRSFFTRQLEGMPAGFKIFKDSLHQRRLYLNFSTAGLYQQASKCDMNRILLEVKNYEKYAGDGAPQYCYELTGPAHVQEKRLQELMKADLDRYLNLHGRFETREVDCYRIKKTKRFVNADPAIKADIRQNSDETIIQFTAVPIKTLTRDLNSQPRSWPGSLIFIDDTDAGDRISIDLPWTALKDVRQLADLLKRKGIVLSKEKCKLEMFVIRDK